MYFTMILNLGQFQHKVMQSIIVGLMILGPLSDPIFVLIITLHYPFKVELEALQLKKLSIAYGLSKYKYSKSHCDHFETFLCYPFDQMALYDHNG